MIIGHSIAHRLVTARCVIIGSENAENTANFPNSWNDALMITIYEMKGDCTTYGISCGIALLETAGKVHVRILLRKLDAWWWWSMLTALKMAGNQ